MENHHVINMSDLRYIRNIDWEDVFDDWRKNEASQEGWQRTAQEKGWPDWETWRSYLADLLRLKEREWKLYTIDNPAEVIPKFLVGPFNSWQKIVPPSEINQINFEKYLRLDLERWRTHGKVEGLIENYPQRTRIIGLIEPKSQKIVGIEGTHRCMAIALAEHEGIPLPADIHVELALAKIQADERDLLTHVLKTGTSKPQME